MDVAKLVGPALLLANCTVSELWQLKKWDFRMSPAVSGTRKNFKKMVVVTGIQIPHGINLRKIYLDERKSWTRHST